MAHPPVSQLPVKKRNTRRKNRQPAAALEGLGGAFQIRVLKAIAAPIQTVCQGSAD